LNRLVTHQFLHSAKVHASHYQSARERVAQAVPREILDLRLLEYAFKRLARSHETLTAVVEKNVRRTILRFLRSA